MNYTSEFAAEFDAIRQEISSFAQMHLASLYENRVYNGCPACPNNDITLKDGLNDCRWNPHLTRRCAGLYLMTAVLWALFIAFWVNFGIILYTHAQRRAKKQRELEEKRTAEKERTA